MLEIYSKEDSEELAARFDNSNNFRYCAHCGKTTETETFIGIKEPNEGLIVTFCFNCFNHLHTIFKELHDKDTLTNN